VVYASPNAISAYRRLGVVDNVIGRNLGEFDLDDEAVLEALADGEPLESEVEARGAVVLRRLLPLTREHHVLGGLMLVREVTELRRHERLLLYKDATIREIHHRVKNNLQTVASLLRLQSRRLTSDESRRPWRSRCGASPRSRWCTRRCRRTAASGCRSTRSRSGWWRCSGRA
jgi:two-component system, sensor histidine kinase PdtaS